MIRHTQTYGIKSTTKLRDNQKRVATFFSHRKHAVCVDRAGAGKCKAGYSRIQTSLGFVKLESFWSYIDRHKELHKNIIKLGEGEEIIYADSTPFKGIKVSTRQGEKPIKIFYRKKKATLRTLTLENNVTVNGTLNHPILTLKCSQPVLYPIGMLKEGDIVLLSATQEHWKTSSFSSYTEDEFYFIGHWLGDGSSAFSFGKERYSVESSERDIIEHLERVIPGKHKISMTKNNTWRFWLRGKENDFLWNLFHKHCTAENKHVPVKLWNMSCSQKLWFLWGLIDSDGTITKGEVDITLKSKRLIDEISDLYLTLGLDIYKSVRVLKKGKYKGNKYYRVRVRKESASTLLSINHNSRKFRELQDYVYNNEYDSLLNTEDYVYFQDEIRYQILNDDLFRKLTEKNREIYHSLKRGRKRSSKANVANAKDLFGKLNWVQDYHFARIKSFTDTEETVYDIEVDSYEHEFMSEGVANHNTLATVSAFISLYNRDKVDTLLVFTPKNAYDKLVWKTDCFKHTNVTPIDLETLAAKVGVNDDALVKYLQKYPVVYGKHTHPKNYMDLIIRITKLSRCVICCDECHKFKSTGTELTLNMKLAIQNSFARWNLTASPLSKNLTDCYNIINFTKPWFLGTFDSFKREFCVVRNKVIGRYAGGRLHKIEEIVGIANEAALNKKLSAIVISGESKIIPVFKYVDYEMDSHESSLYRRLALGLFNPSYDDITSKEEWFRRVMGEEQVEQQYQIKSVEKHSSRFLYLQYVADGIVSETGEVGKRTGSKIKKLAALVNHLKSKGESCLVYFDYYASLDAAKYALKKYCPGVKVLELSGREQYKISEISEQSVKNQSYVILLTRAGSESVSYYYINNVVFFEIPTVPTAMIQAAGRILRLNTLFDQGQHKIWIFRSDNIDMYKLGIVANKTAQSEVITGWEASVPDEYKQKFKDSDTLELAKKYLLWNQSKSKTFLSELV